LLGAVFSSVVAIQIKQLSRIDSADTIVFYTYSFWVPMSLIPALFAWHWPSGTAWLWLACTGLFGTGAQLLWTRALRLGEVSALTPISFMQLPFVSLLSYILFDEHISRWTALGAGIIFLANAYIAHRESQLSRRAATNAPTEAAKPGE
ncbi:MAG TPA: DMT family transporter, partial [Xanthomonadaceae bacterium]|nr:DMT family transporter [Xanthomonadaceae bacterium]